VCALAAFNRANFAILAVMMGLHVLFFQRPLSDREAGAGGGGGGGGGGVGAEQPRDRVTAKGKKWKAKAEASPRLPAPPTLRAPAATETIPHSVVVGCVGVTTRLELG